MFFGKIFPYPSQNLPKTNMVRMVHRKGFYNTELKNCDPKMELWGKIEFLRRSKKFKILFGVQNLTFEEAFKDKIIFKIL